MRRRLITLVFAAAVLGGAAPIADAASTPQARAEAAAFVRATRGAVAALRRQGPAFHRSVVGYVRGRRACRAVLDHDRHAVEAYDLEHNGQRWATGRPVIGVLEGFAAELRAVHPKDPSLRRAAEAWRVLARPLVQEPKPSVCSAFVHWRHGGYPVDRRPVDDRVQARAERRESAATDDVERGAMRLRALGVPAGAADRFSSYGLRDVLAPALPRGPVRRIGWRAYRTKRGGRVLEIVLGRGAIQESSLRLAEGPGRVTVTLLARYPPPFDALGDDIGIPLYAVEECLAVGLRRPLGDRRVFDGSRRRAPGPFDGRRGCRRVRPGRLRPVAR